MPRARGDETLEWMSCGLRGQPERPILPQPFRFDQGLSSGPLPGPIIRDFEFGRGRGKLSRERRVSPCVKPKRSVRREHTCFPFSP